MNDRISNSILNVDKERLQTQQLVQSLFHHLYDYITPATKRDVMDKLYEFFEKTDVVVISKPQFKVYQEYEKLMLDKIMLTPNTPIQPSNE